jgi:4-hydroxybenzoate polyprenyltransferase
VSGLYCVNDIIDLKSDKLHLLKKNRPLASEKLIINQVLGLAILCFCLSFGLIKFFKNGGGGVLWTNEIFNFYFYYIIIFLLYGLFLKKKFLINIITLSLFYVYRILLGSKVIAIETTSNLIIFIFFFFMTLSSVKKYIDINMQKIKDVMSLKILIYIIIFSSTITINILIIYLNTNSPNIILSNLNLYAIIVIITYWLLSTMIKTFLGQIKIDPIIYFLKDKNSLICIVILGMLLMFDLNNIIFQ